MSDDLATDIDGLARSLERKAEALETCRRDKAYLTQRLARFEAACLLRSEIDAPGYCQIWNKDPWGNCHWIEYDSEDLNNPPQIGPAPDYRPEEPGPITLPILEV